MATRPPVRLARRQAYRRALRISGLSSTTTRKMRSSARLASVRLACSLMTPSLSALAACAAALDTPHDRAAEPTDDHGHQNRAQTIKRPVIVRPAGKLGAEPDLADRQGTRHRRDDLALAHEIDPDLVDTLR